MFQSYCKVYILYRIICILREGRIVTPLIFNRFYKPCFANFCLQLQLLAGNLIKPIDFEMFFSWSFNFSVRHRYQQGLILTFWGLNFPAFPISILFVLVEEIAFLLNFWNLLFKKIRSGHTSLTFISLNTPPRFLCPRRKATGALSFTLVRPVFVSVH